MATIDLAGLLKSMTAERTKKYGEGLSSLKSALNLFGADDMSGMERETMAGIEQSAAGRGLSGTTVPVAASGIAKAGFRDIRRSRLADILKSIAGYTQGGTPGAGDIAHLATGGFSGLLQQQQQKLMSTPFNAFNYPAGTVFPFL